MTKNALIIISVLLVSNIAISLWSIYNERKNQERVCLTIATINDQVMTKLNGTSFDQNTAQILNNCFGGSPYIGQAEDIIK